MPASRTQHNISLTEPQEELLRRVRAAHPGVSLADMVMAMAKSLDTPLDTVGGQPLEDEE